MTHHSILPGCPDSMVWDRADYLAANEGWGMHNTGSGKPVICCLGGIGCDVDHVSIKRTTEGDERERIRRSVIDEIGVTTDSAGGW